MKKSHHFFNPKNISLPFPPVPPRRDLFAPRNDSRWYVPGRRKIHHFKYKNHHFKYKVHHFKYKNHHFKYKMHRFYNAHGREVVAHVRRVP